MNEILIVFGLAYLALMLSILVVVVVRLQPSKTVYEYTYREVPVVMPEEVTQLTEDGDIITKKGEDLEIYDPDVERGDDKEFLEEATELLDDMDAFEKAHGIDTSKPRQVFDNDKGEMIMTAQKKDLPKAFPTTAKMKGRKRHVHLSKKEQMELYQTHVARPDIELNVLAEGYDVSRSTVDRIIEDKGM